MGGYELPRGVESMKTILTAIAAVDSNFALGHDNKLLLKDKTDMENFKKYTIGHTVIMGRKTYESIGSKPLSNRNNIVLTRNKDSIKPKKHLMVINDVSELCTYISNRNITIKDEYYVIGGGEVYNLLLPYTESIILTQFKYEFTDPKPDTYFPRVDELDTWKCDEYLNVYLTKEGYKAKICKWVRNG